MNLYELSKEIKEFMEVNKNEIQGLSDKNLISFLEHENSILEYIQQNLNMHNQMTDEALLDMLHLTSQFQKQRLSFFSRSPNTQLQEAISNRIPNQHLFEKMLPILEPSRVTESPLLAQNKKEFTNLLRKLHQELSEIYDARENHQYRAKVNYTERMINQSTSFIEYTKASRSAKYNDGSLVVDAIRDGEFVVNNQIIDPNESYYQDQAEMDKQIELTQQILVDKEQIISKNFSGEERINELKAAKDFCEEKIKALELKKIDREHYHRTNEILDLLAQFIQEPNPIEKKKKVDMLNRFGHQMIEAQFMQEFQNNYNIPGFLLLVMPGKEKKHQVVFDKNGKVYIDCELPFGGVMCASEKELLYGVMGANKRNIDLTPEPPGTENDTMGVLKGRIELVPEPKSDTGYAMHITQFQVVLYTPDIQTNFKKIEENYKRKENNKKSENRLSK